MEKNLAIKAENTRPVDYAIKVNGVSKTFRIPHEKITSLRGAFVNAFSGNKGYEEFKAVDDVSFEVKKGENSKSLSIVIRKCYNCNQKG